MLTLTKLLQQNSRPGYAPLVDSLLQRVSESALADDRREALQQLRDLLTEQGDARVAFGSVGLPTMCALVRDSRDDVDQLRVALECLGAAVGPMGAEGQTAAAVNAEQLLRNAECVPTLLSLLDDEPLGVSDFYVRFYTLDVLKGLLAANAQLLQECVLGAPLGVVRLMGVLSERDALRNEALLVLQQLVLGNAELQKVAVFEGAFDRVLAILGEEGLLEGGIVVQDCLLLLMSLLRGNPSNQLMFREMGFLAQFLSSLAALAKTTGGLEAGDQPCHNLQAALQLLAVLIAPQGPGAGGTGTQSQCSHNKQLLAKQHFQQVLLDLALGSSACPDSAVRAQAFACLAGMLSSSTQDGAALRQQPEVQLGKPDLGQLLAAALHAGDGAEQAAADLVLEAAYTGCAKAQVAAAFGLSPGPGGQELARALASTDAELSSRAASIVSYIVRGNAEAQQRLAQHLAQELSNCTRQLASLLLAPQNELARQQSLRFIKLLLSWLPGCASAMAAFLHTATARPFLVGVVSGAQCSDLVLRGLVAILLGLCALVGRGPQATAHVAMGVPTSSMLMEVIVGQIGLEEFRGLLGGLAQRMAVVGCAVGGALPDLIPSGTLVSLSYYTYVAGLVKEVTLGLARPVQASAAAVVPQQPKEFHPMVPQALDRSVLAIAPLAANSQAHAESSIHPFGMETISLRPSEPTSIASQPVHDGSLTRTAIEEQQRSISSANDAVSSTAEISQLKDQLQAAVKEAELSKLEATNLRDALHKLECELEDLSTAYAMLEAHSQGLQAKLEEERNRSATDATIESEPPQDDGDPLEDLLVCLGQEEAKVARLSARLAELGIDSSPLIQDLDH